MKLMTCTLVLAISTMVFAEDAPNVENRELRRTIESQKQEIKKLKFHINRLARKLAEKDKMPGNKPEAVDKALKGQPGVIVYLGKKRTNKWFEKMYTQFHDKIALVDGKYYDIGERKLRLETLKIQNENRVNPSEPSRIILPRKVGLFEYLGGTHFNSPKVLQILDPKELLVRGYRTYHITGVSTKGLVTEDGFFAWVIYVGTYQYVTTNGGTQTIASYSAYSPLTKNQFRESLLKGFRLIEYRLKKVTPPKKKKLHWSRGLIAWRRRRSPKKGGIGIHIYNKIISRPVP